MRQYHLSAPARMNAVMEMHLESVFAADEAPKTRTCIRTRSARTAFNYVCKRTPTPNPPPIPHPSPHPASHRHVGMAIIPGTQPPPFYAPLEMRLLVRDTLRIMDFQQRNASAQQHKQAQAQKSS